MEIDTLSCRACGAPRELERPCDACGARQMGDDEVARLLLHRDRLLRSQQRLRALAVSLGVDYARDWRAYVAGYSIAGGIIALIGVWFLPVPTPYRLASFSLTLLVIWTAWRLHLRVDSDLRAAAYAKTDEMMDALAGGVAARCAECGGYSTVPRFDIASGHPCPWCSAVLVAEETMRRAAADSVEGKFGRLLEQARNAWRESSTQGWRHGEGNSYFSLLQPYGNPGWSLSVGFEGSQVSRFEVDIELVLERRLLFVPTETEAFVRRLGAVRRADLPDERIEALQADGIDWLAYSDTTEPLDDAWKWEIALASFGQKHCLLLDRAGLSLWTTGLVNRSDEEEFDAAVGLLQDLNLAR